METPELNGSAGATPAPYRFPCERCGANLHYVPGSAVLRCEYCGYENRIALSRAAILEQDFRQTLAELERGEATQESITHHCASCGAQYTLDPNSHAGQCPFCGAPVVTTTERHRQIPPAALLPFRITREQAREAFRRWLGKLWFAPGKLKEYGRGDTSLAGIYMPYWTYDAATLSTYQGERGDYYQVPETYETVENGRPVTRTRMVTKIRWTPASGRVSRTFDDVLVLASQTLPRRITERLEPWDLANLEPYRAEYLSGFRSEMYQVNLAQGFEYARNIMAQVIRGEVARDIGGDQQRIHRVDTRYAEIRFKHILLPIWLATFRFKNKSYRFVVNGRTGEVQGERPYSPWKIAAAIGLAALLLGAAIMIWMAAQGPQGV